MQLKSSNMMMEQRLESFNMNHMCHGQNIQHMGCGHPFHIGNPNMMGIKIRVVASQNQLQLYLQNLRRNWHLHAPSKSFPCQGTAMSSSLETMPTRKKPGATMSQRPSGIHRARRLVFFCKQPQDPWCCYIWIYMVTWIPYDPHQYTPNVSIYTIHGSYGIAHQNPRGEDAAKLGKLAFQTLQTQLETEVATGSSPVLVCKIWGRLFFGVSIFHI